MSALLLLGAAYLGIMVCAYIIGGYEAEKIKLDNVQVDLGVRLLAEQSARIAELEAMLRKNASTDALDDICILLDEPEWEYPGQVVRDVAKAIGMSLDEMTAKLQAKRKGGE